MISPKSGGEFPGAEVTTISTKGLWVLVGDEELFLSHKNFPWFKRAAVEAVLEVQLVSATHLYWPKLDIDLGVDSIKEPEHFPLQAND